MASPSEPGTSVTLLGKLRQCPTDQSAWEQFVQRYGPKIYGRCRRWNMQDADAQDVAQMVLLRLAARMRDFQYDPARSFRAWLMTITQHAWSDFVTGRNNQVGSGDSRVGKMLDSLQARDDLVSRLNQAYDRELLEQAMSRVRVRVQAHTWEAFQLMAIEGADGADVAARLHMKVTSVFKARSNVQKLIREELHRLEGAESP